jgi:hypothetical protein
MIRMIGRGFWLTLGVVLGVGGYRKAARLARAVSPVRPTARDASWTAQPAETAPGATTAQVSWTAGTAVKAALVRGIRAGAGFARDVREGMRIYRLSYRREAPTLGGHRATKDWAFAEGEFPDEVKDGR